jgi:hypothetical protein
MAFTEEQLKAILSSHALWVRSSETEGEKASFMGADLGGVDLRHACLCEADFRNATLDRVNLHGADLYGADFSGSDLQHSSLSCANLSDADFRGANLYCADLYGVYAARTQGLITFYLGVFSGHMTLHDKQVTIGCTSLSLDDFLARADELIIEHDIPGDLAHKLKAFGLFLKANY